MVFSSSVTWAVSPSLSVKLYVNKDARKDQNEQLVLFLFCNGYVLIGKDV